MKIIPLTKGKFAKVDDEDFDKVNQFKWRYSDGYARRWSFRVFGERKMMHMSRFVMNTPEAMECDHINHDTLDNRKCNLRNVTRSQNHMNRFVYSNNRLGVKGVSKHGRKFVASIQKEGKRVWQQSYTTLEEAKIAYEEKAKELFGEYRLK